MTEPTTLLKQCYMFFCMSQIHFRMVDLCRRGHRIQSSLVNRLFGPRNVTNLLFFCLRHPFAATSSWATTKVSR